MELFKIILTSGLTIIGGMLLFMLQRFLVEPAHEQSKAIGEIYFGLMYYARWYSHPGPRPEKAMATALEAGDAIRRYASQLCGTTHAIRWYSLFQYLKLVPERQNVNKAVDKLILISNSIETGDGRETRTDAECVRALLALPKWCWKGKRL